MRAVTLARHVLFVIALGFVAAFAASAQAGPFEEGVAAYERGDYATALRLWRPLAEQGDGGAQFNLGLMYGNGWGVPQDDAEAVKWLRGAAEQGHTEAVNRLREVATRGNAEAVKWLRGAAEQGHAEAQYNLGLMYRDGEGVPQHFLLAHMWFNLAGASGHRLARIARAAFAKKMTPAQIAEAQRLAREWKPK